MPAASEPTRRPELPHTWRPFGVRMAGAGLRRRAARRRARSRGSASTTRPARGSRSSSGARWSFLGLLFFAAGYALARSRVVAETDRLVVVNGYRRRDYEWAEVLAVHLPPGAPWAVLDLADGTSQSAMGIQGSDGDRARRAVRELRLAARPAGAVRDDQVGAFPGPLLGEVDLLGPRPRLPVGGERVAVALQPAPHPQRRTAPRPRPARWPAGRRGSAPEPTPSTTTQRRRLEDHARPRTVRRASRSAAHGPADRRRAAPAGPSSVAASPPSPSQPSSRSSVCTTARSGLRGERGREGGLAGAGRAVDADQPAAAERRRGPRRAAPATARAVAAGSCATPPG